MRTIVCREVVPGPKKDRWHPLYTTSQAEPWEVLQTFRTRQHHEQGYRVDVHDEFLNAVPCGYDKESPNRKRPRFHRGPLQMIGWLAGLVYNAIADLTDRLPDRYHGAHVATARRTFFNQAGTSLSHAEHADRPIQPLRQARDIDSPDRFAQPPSQSPSLARQSPAGSLLDSPETSLAPDRSMPLLTSSH